MMQLMDDVKAVPEAGRKPRILVVEDLEDARTMLQLLLAISLKMPVDTAVAGGQILTSAVGTTDVRVRLASTAGLNTPPTWSVTSKSAGAATLAITHNADKSATIPISRAAPTAYLLRCVVNGGSGQAGGDTRSLALKVATATGLELLVVRDLHDHRDRVDDVLVHMARVVAEVVAELGHAIVRRLHVVARDLTDVLDPGDELLVGIRLAIQASPLCRDSQPTHDDHKRD